MSFIPGQERLNRVIELLEQRQVVYGPWFVENGELRSLQRWGDSECDVVVIDMEHEDFDTGLLRVSLQSLLNRGRISAEGVQARPTPVVRVPTTGGEHADWVIKQVLDAGVYGIVIPNVESVEHLEHVVGAARYPQERDAPPVGPPGRRGVFLRTAARYWGVARDEYARRARPWPLEPAGELLVIAMIESVRGVEALDEICGSGLVSAVWPGTGDLRASMGLLGGGAADEVEANVQRILATALAHDVPALILAPSAEEARRRVNQGFRIVLHPEGRHLAHDRLSAAT